uniref:Uncharacterized protein n=1 Tax=Rhizophora mucronata TaxID=61149 RepID=A0A2P2NXJ2_RHIMU
MHSCLFDRHQAVPLVQLHLVFQASSQ